MSFCTRTSPRAHASEKATSSRLLRIRADHKQRWSTLPFIKDFSISPMEEAVRHPCDIIADRPMRRHELHVAGIRIGKLVAEVQDILEQHTHLARQLDPALGENG